MAAHAYYRTRIDVSMDDAVPVMVSTNYLISIYYVAVGRCDRAFLVGPEQMPSNRCKSQAPRRTSTIWMEKNNVWDVSLSYFIGIASLVGVDGGGGGGSHMIAVMPYTRH